MTVTELYTDGAGVALSADAMIGRRICIWDRTASAFGKEGRVQGWAWQQHPHGHMHRMFFVSYDEGGTGFLAATDFAMPGLTDEMLARGADALFDSYRRQRDPAKVKAQRKTALAHAKLVLEAAIEG